MSKYEYTFLQQLFGGLGFSLPQCDVVSRPLDTTDAGASVKAALPSKAWEDTPIEIKPSTKKIQCLNGHPMQRTGTSTEQWRVLDIAAGKNEALTINKPISGSFWIEGNPQIGGEWDKHWIGVRDDGYVIEAIGTNVGAKTFYRAGVWQDGKLVWGSAVTASGVALHNKLVNYNDPQHVMMIGLAMYGGGDATDPEVNKWLFPRCGQRVVLSQDKHDELAEGATAEQQVFLDAARKKGFVFNDKFSATATATGAKLRMATNPVGWAKSSLPKLDGKIKMRDLELVTDYG